MSKADRLKEELNWFKLFFVAFLAIDVSLIAWLAQNYLAAETIIVMGAFVAIIIITSGLVYITRLAHKRIELLEHS